MNLTSPERQGKGTVFVRPEICKGCSFCIDFCPTHCLEFTKDFNAKGYHFPILQRLRPVRPVLPRLRHLRRALEGHRRTPGQGPARGNRLRAQADRRTTSAGPRAG
jgi:ferredoxin